MFRLPCCAFLTVLFALPLHAEKRAMEVQDLYRLKRIGDPQISPDGKLVVYQVSNVNLDENKSSTNLWIAEADGKTPPRRLTTTTKSDHHPRWSPDGQRILFESSRSGDSQLWVIDLNGGEARQVTSISTGASNGIWSPDGNNVAFVSAVYPEFSDKPFKEADALNKKKMDEAAQSPVKAKVFTRLFFRHWVEYVEDKRNHLFVVPLAGGEPKDVTPGDRDAYPTSTTFSVGDDFVFSPNGKYLVYTAVPDRDEAWSTNYDLCRVAIEGGKIENLTADNKAADSSPRFAPNGKVMAYRAQKKAGYEAAKWELMVVACDESGAWTGKPHGVTPKLDASVEEFVWGPDSKTLFFTADDDGSRPIFETAVGVGHVTPFQKGGVTGSVSISRDGNTMAFTKAAMNYPPHVSVVRTSAPNFLGQSTITSSCLTRSICRAPNR